MFIALRLSGYAWACNYVRRLCMETTGDEGCLLLLMGLCMSLEVAVCRMSIPMTVSLRPVVFSYLSCCYDEIPRTV